MNKTVFDLLDEYSDFYKDIHGFRPSLEKPRSMYTIVEAEMLIASCSAYLSKVAQSPLGRQQLENEGWDLWYPERVTEDQTAR